MSRRNRQPADERPAVPPPPADDTGARPPFGQLYLVPDSDYHPEGGLLSDGRRFRTANLGVGDGYWALSQEFVRWAQPLQNGSAPVYQKTWRWFRVTCTESCPPPASPFETMGKVLLSGAGLAASIMTGNVPGAIGSGAALVGTIASAARR